MSSWTFEPPSGGLRHHCMPLDAPCTRCGFDGVVVREEPEEFTEEGEVVWCARCGHTCYVCASPTSEGISVNWHLPGKFLSKEEIILLRELSDE